MDNVILEGEYSRVTLDLQRNGALSNKLNLDIGYDRDFLREVTLEGSDDNFTWHLIQRDRIFSIKSGITDTELLYPNTSFRYLRVTIDSKGEKPLGISGARVGFTPVETENLEAVPGKMTSLEQIKGNTEIVLDLGVKGYRIENIVLNAAGQNYNRKVEVFISNDSSEWHVFGGGTVYHYKWPGYEAAENKLNLGILGERYLKMVIYNQDSPALDIGGVEIWGGYPG
ncbi:hypothetical protein N752_08815 [Desulforamulus aquiferis]|nr:DUF3999 family protein [Desulforamulus aquiferis]RYD05436.1 hypothetical protein N752_08815 [Desulforamulus aquiferis]